MLNGGMLKLTKMHQRTVKKIIKVISFPVNQAALLNINCDCRAEEMYTTAHQDLLPHHNPIIPKEMKVWFVSNDIVNTAKLQSQIVQDRHTPSLKIYIMKKQNEIMSNLSL